MKTSLPQYMFKITVLKRMIPQLMYTYILTKWGVHLVIAKEIMALITTAPLGVRLQAFLEQHVSPSSQWPCFLWRFYLCLSNFDYILTFCIYNYILTINLTIILTWMFFDIIKRRCYPPFYFNRKSNYQVKLR